MDPPVSPYQLDQIEALFKGGIGPDPTAADSLEKLFDLVLTNPIPQTDRMLWHFRYDGPNYEVLALDSRTWRSYEDDPNDLLREPFFDEETAALLTDQALRMQIPDQPGPGINPAGVCIVIAAAPFLGYPIVESTAQPLVNLIEMVFNEPEPPFKRWGRSFKFGRVAHDPETWGYRPRLFEAVLARLATRNRVIFFSGDVHYSFGSQMNYWVLNPDGSKRSATRFVQLTASSMRAQESKVKALPAIDLVQQLGGLSSNQTRFGWFRGTAGTPEEKPPVEPGHQPFSQFLSQSLLDDPILVSPDGVPADAFYRRQPQWMWQMGPAQDERPDTARFTAPSPPSFSNAGHVELLQSVARRHVWHAQYSMPRRWHWWTNFTTVTFDPAPDGTPGNVIFTVYSYDPAGSEVTTQPFLLAKVDLSVPGAPPVVNVEPA